MGTYRSDKNIKQPKRIILKLSLDQYLMLPLENN